MKVEKRTYFEIKPFLSVIIIIATLFFVVLSKMEIRRIGYSVLKASRDQIRLEEKKRQKMVRLAKRMQPSSVEKFVQRGWVPKGSKDHRIILMTDSNIAFQQEK